MIVLVLIFYALIFMYDFLPLYKEKQRKMIRVYSVLGVLSLAVAVLLSFNVRIPSPEVPIRQLVTSIFGK